MEIAAVYPTPRQIEPNEANECLIWVKDTTPSALQPPTCLISSNVSTALGSIDNSISGLGIGLYLVKELVTRQTAMY